MEYKRCIKITDNKLTDLREYTQSLVKIDTDDSGWGWNGQVALQSRIKDAVMKMCSDRAITGGETIYPLMYSWYNLNSDGTYANIILKFGYYFANDDYTTFDISVDFNNEKILSEYAEV